MKLRHSAVLASRLVLGLIFMASGVNYFFPFFSEPTEPPRVVAFVDALKATGYMWPLIRLTEVAGGALMVADRFVPLALLVLAPVVINIVALHVFLSPQFLPTAVLVAAPELFLAWEYWNSFAPLFS